MLGVGLENAGRRVPPLQRSKDPKAHSSARSPMPDAGERGDGSKTSPASRCLGGEDPERAA
eukprot:835913-Rhodomonas_salina.1